MLNLSKIQLDLERAKEKLRSVEETIQKVEGKTFSNGPVRYSSLKIELHPEKTRHPIGIEDVKNQRRRVIASSVDSRVQRLASDDAAFNLKRGLREKREPMMGFKRPGGDNKPQGVFARLSGLPYQQADDEDEDDFVKKPTLPSRVITTASEAPSRQEVIAAQSVDEQSKQRNKRMFGALVGTLQKFRKEETRVREREEKRLKVEKKLEEDAKREKEKLIQEKRELFLEKKRREVEIKRIEWSLNRVKEYEAWEANVIPLKNFIQTQAKPHIFYLPTVHNAKTQERLAYSQKVVDRMIEKRKTNLKEEIENSEKKAKKTAAEEVEAEEEEAENIPEDNEEARIPEQSVQVDFATENKENGYFEEGTKDQAKNSDDIKKTEDSGKADENWGGAQESEVQKSNECLGSKHEVASSNKDESKEESPLAESKVNEFSINEERSGDGERGDGKDVVGKSDEDESGYRDEGGLCEGEEDTRTEVEKESGEVEPCTNEHGDPNGVESENCEKDLQDEENKPDLSLAEAKEETVDKEEKLKIYDTKELVSESEPKVEDSSKKKSESNDEKNKSCDLSRTREKSRSKKPSRRSRSPRRRSRSPRNNRRRSSSRRKKTLRKRSRSGSPPRKSRKSSSPISRRGGGSSSRKKTPQAKSRRRSFSRSSSSVSPRKKRSGSSSSASKSD